MGKSGMAEKYVRLVHGNETVVRYAVETTESFKVKVGRHQGTALRPFLFAVITDRLIDKVRREPSWTMLEICIGKNDGNDDETLKMENTKVPRVKEFKYLESMVQESGGCEREVMRRVQAGWNVWGKVSGVICDKRLPARVKGKVYGTVVRPAMVYRLETVAVTKKQVEEIEVAEMKMLRFAMGVTRKD